MLPVYVVKGSARYRWINSLWILLAAKNSDMEKVKKFPLAEFLGFISSAKKYVILDMSKAKKIAKIVVYFQNYTLETSFIDHWTFYIVQDSFRRKLVELIMFLIKRQRYLSNIILFLFCFPPKASQNNESHLKMFPPKPQKISTSAARLLGCFSMSANNMNFEHFTQFVPKILWKKTHLG